MSKLLIQESPLTFQPSLAIAIGLNEAIVLQQIHYWLTNSKNKGYEQDGYKWVYNSYKEWKETNFPFWSENTIQRTFTSLEEKGLLIAIQPMKSRYDRTKYYRIDYTKLDTFDDTKIRGIDDPNLVCSLNESENTTENTSKEVVSELPKTDETKGDYITQADQKVGAILDFEKRITERNSWEGRAFFRPDHLPLVDWYHERTGQTCPKSKQKDWMRALLDWTANNLTVADLQAAYEMDITWRGVFTSPNQLTEKAIAIKAARKNAPQPIEGKGFYG